MNCLAVHRAQISCAVRDAPTRVTSLIRFARSISGGGEFRVPEARIWAWRYQDTPRDGTPREGAIDIYESKKSIPGARQSDQTYLLYLNVVLALETTPRARQNQRLLTIPTTEHDDQGNSLQIPPSRFKYYLHTYRWGIFNQDF